MSIRLLSAVAAMGLAFLIAGCQTGPLYSGTGYVAPEDTVSVAQGRGGGTWKGRDLSVAYKYSRDRGGMDISGTIDFADHMTYNFTNLHDFRLSVYFLDESGKVLLTNGLTTQRGGLDPIPFHSKLMLPAGAVSMAFSYQGTALEGGGGGEGGGVSYFWQYPVH
jgi:hypothetical protein